MSFVNLLYITNHIAVTCPIIENGNCQFSNSVALKSAVNDWESQGCSTDPSCSTIETYGHVTTWCTSGITDMSNLFDGKSTFNEPIGSFDTSSVTTMNRMIHHAHDFNQPIGSWNTSKVRNMAGMFNNARSFNQNVAGWNVSSVETMFQMFAGAFAFNQPNLCPWKDAPALINNNDENMFLDSLGGGPKATDNSFDASLCVIANGIGLPTQSVNAAPAIVTLPVERSGCSVDNVVIALGIDYHAAGRLIMNLNSPDGTGVILVASAQGDRPPGGNDSSNLVSANPITFDDSSTNINPQTLGDGGNAFFDIPAGTYNAQGNGLSINDVYPNPEGLSKFFGLDAEGDWTFDVVDVFSSGAVTVRSVDLTITCLENSPTTLELFFEADNVGQGIATGWLGQQTFCNNQGKRLCKLDELCQARGHYAEPFTQAFATNFDIPAVVSGADNWIAYETNDDTRQDNCGVYGGCSLNAWIQIGNRLNSQGASQTCNTHCEVSTDANAPQYACPSWGLEANQSFMPTVAVCCDDHE